MEKKIQLVCDFLKLLAVAVSFSIINHFLLETEKKVSWKSSSFEFHDNK